MQLFALTDREPGMFAIAKGSGRESRPSTLEKLSYLIASLLSSFTSTHPVYPIDGSQRKA
jgi:hypothetical protein